MNCTEFRSTYSDFADGLLDERGEITAHRHLSECSGCRRFHEALQWGVSELRRQPKVLPSIDFAARLEQRLQAEFSPVASAVRQGSSAAATLMVFTLVAAGVFAYDLARHQAAPRVATDVAGPLPALGANAFQPTARYVSYVVAEKPFAPAAETIIPAQRESLLPEAELAGAALTR